MSSERNTNTQGGDYAEGNIDKRQGVFVEGGLVYGPLVGENKGTINYYSSLSSALTPQQQRNRNAMLQKVKIIWIDGLLKNSLAEAVRIELGLETRPDAVDLC